MGLRPSERWRRDLLAYAEAWRGVVSWRLDEISDAGMAASRGLQVIRDHFSHLDASSRTGNWATLAESLAYDGLEARE